MIGEHYIPHFWRGFIDADGCWYVNRKHHLRQFSIAGPAGYDWSEFTFLLDSLNITWEHKERESKKGHKHSVICITGRRNLVDLICYLYRNHPFCLTRKKDKVNQLLASYTN